MDKYFYVYYVFHNRIIGNDPVGQPIYDEKDIGLYSTQKNADNAVNHFKYLPGFVQFPNDFHIQRRRCYVADKKGKTKQNNTVIYMPYHECYDSENDYDSVTKGCFFLDKNEAEKVIEEWKKDHILSQHPEGFNILEYKLDSDNILWSEGFF